MFLQRGLLLGRVCVEWVEGGWGLGRGGGQTARRRQNPGCISPLLWVQYESNVHKQSVQLSPTDHWRPSLRTMLINFSERLTFTALWGIEINYENAPLIQPDVKSPPSSLDGGSSAHATPESLQFSDKASPGGFLLQPALDVPFPQAINQLTRFLFFFLRYCDMVRKFALWGHFHAFV